MDTEYPHHIKYCAYCGHDNLDFDAAESAFKCRICSRRSFLNSKPSVCAVIVRDSRVLLVRSTNSTGGAWDLPGGFLLFGETPEDGLKRELREELNGDIEVGELLGALVDVYGRPFEYSLNLFYMTALTTENLQAGSDTSAFDWFDLSSLPLLQFESTKNMLANLHSKLDCPPS